MKNLNEFVDLPDKEKEAVLRDVVKKANQDQLDEFNAINEDYVVDKFYDLADDNIEQTKLEQWSMFFAALLLACLPLVVIVALIAKAILQWVK
jgi:hypothetical protein